MSNSQYSHEYYHINGITDLSVMKAQAERGMKNGQKVLIHNHRQKESCKEKEHFEYVETS